MKLCASTTTDIRDPRFQALREAYKDRHYSDDHIAQALQLCREKKGYRDDWFPETPGQKGVFTRFMNYEMTFARVAKTDSENTRDSVYNLYTTLYAVFTPEQLDSRLGMLAHDFRELVDHLQKKDKTNRSRQQLIESLGTDKKNGFKRIMEEVFNIYQKSYLDVDARMAAYEKSHPDMTDEEKAEKRELLEYIAQEYKTVLANKDRLSALVATRIGEEEGFSVNVRGFEVDFEEAEDGEDSLDDQDDETSDPDGINVDKTEGSKGDRYTDFRLLKLMQSLSPQAKRFLSSIKKTDTKGRIIRDDIGREQYIGPRQAAVVLKKVLVTASPDSMMDVLRAAKDSYPWLQGVIDELNRQPDFRSVIYSAFKSAETTYVYTNAENSGYGMHIANSRAAGNALTIEAGTNLRGGYVLDEDHSIYTGFGALKSKEKIDEIKKEFNDLAGFIRTMTSGIKMVEGDVNRPLMYVEKDIETAAKKGYDLSHLRLRGEESMSAFLEKYPEIPEKIASFLRGMGFNVSTEDIKDVALQTSTKKSFKFIAGKRTGTGRNKLYQLVEKMGGVFDRIDQIYSQGLTTTGEYLFNTSNSFRAINRCIALSQYKEVEPRVLNEGKSLSTYNNMNLLHQVFDFLANKDGRDEEKYQADLEAEFLQYEGMALGKGKDRKLTGWLKRFQESPENMGSNEFRDNVRVVDQLGFNHVDYAKLSRAQKMTQSMLAFFRGGDVFQNGKYALYEVPIQSDYSTANNFILAPVYNHSTQEDEEGYKRTEGLIDTDSEIVEELKDEVLVELERIAAIEDRIANDPSRVKLSVYEKQGVKFQIFPEFNENDFRKNYIEEKKKGPDLAEDFVRKEVAKQLDKIVRKDLASLEKTGVFTNHLLKKVDIGAKTVVSFYTKDGKIESLKPEAQDALVAYCTNAFFAREQMTKILTGGLEQFNGLIDYEKRNMLTHATRTSLYTDATWRGEKVGRKTQNVVYLGDEEAASGFLADIDTMLQALEDNKVITSQQHKIMKKAYEKIKTTDGQGFRTLDSYRRIQIMTGMWDDRHEAAYRNIKAGHPVKGDIDVFMQNIKPVLTGDEFVPAAKGDLQKPVKLTVLHKYSETVLLPMELAKYCLQTQAVPLQALENAQKTLRKQGKEVDMFLFHSCVKVGAHSILQPFAKWKDIKGTDGRTDEEERKLLGWNGEDLNERIYKTAAQIEKCIVDGVNAKNSVLHTLRLKYYGIAASTPAHVANDKIAWASQAIKVAWANIKDTDKVTVRDKQMLASEAREKFNSITTAEIIENYKKLREQFANSDELERIFREELATKSYSSRELEYALSHLKDGTFALPLFSPNVGHQVQQLLSSIIKKRLTKPRHKGANILQSTSLGMDIDASAFDESTALKKEDKLKVVFEGTGENKRIKYVEVYMPLHDDRLKMFADENGNIGPDQLRKLLDAKIIDERILNFIAYRTPSDAEHSVIPCHIKGFVANTGGATIKMPKEVMVMTGHDYDGDKMRCHFPDFSIRWNNSMIEEAYNGELESIEPGKDIPYQLQSFDNYRKWFISDKNVEDKTFYKKAEYIEYDYDKDPLDQSQTARSNGKIELMFAQLTSKEGSKRVIIPGGCDESKVIAKSLYIVRASTDEASKEKIAEQLKVPVSVVENTSKLYETLIRLSDFQLTDIMRVISGTETPFSVAHAADSYDYIMGGAEMISVYAVYNSAMQMLQRLDMKFLNKLTQKDEVYPVSFFNHPWSNLFEVNNHKGRLGSLSLARLLNAAVDNNKDPILGYLTQTKQMSEMTFLMLAAGMTEEEVHLIMNQPAVIRLIERLKARDSRGLVNEAEALVKDLTKDVVEVDDDMAKLAHVGKDKALGQFIGLKNVSEMKREDYTKSLSLTYDDVKDTSDMTLLKQQVSLLQALSHLNAFASTLGQFVRLTRPESESGAIGTSVAEIITKVANLDNFRKRLKLKRDETTEERDRRIGFSGMDNVLKLRDVDQGWTTSYIEEILGTELPEVVALNSLMLDSSLDMLSPYFPQARQSWVDLATEIAEKYRYKSLQPNIVKKVMEEMILYKLLSDKKFIAGNPQTEQRRIIVDVPKYLQDLNKKIADAEKNRAYALEPGISDEERAKRNAARNIEFEDLIGNEFLSKLSSTKAESDKNPRLMFMLNGPAVEGTADSIRASWGALLNNSTTIGVYRDPEGVERTVKVSDLAIDLFKYNLFTNGFSYGMYEFAHFAPFSVILATPGYVDALYKILRSDWNDDSNRENFINQYYMNHWGDNRFLPTVKLSNIKRVKSPAGVTGQIWVGTDTDDAVIDNIKRNRYIVLLSGEDNREQTLYRVEEGNTEAAVVLVEAQKLGTRNAHSQITLQYNPSVDYHDIRPVVPGNESAWGQLDELNIWAESDINAPGARDFSPMTAEELAFDVQRQMAKQFGIDIEADRLKVVEEKAEKAVEKNDSAESRGKRGSNLNEDEQRKLDEAIAAQFGMTLPDEDASVDMDENGTIGTPDDLDMLMNATAATFGLSGVADAAAMRSAVRGFGTEKLNIVRTDENGNVVSENVPASMRNVAQARKQKTFVELNKRLREILREKGIDVGKLTAAEARMTIGGVADFDSATVTAEGLLELIRIAEGYVGEQALPEEFAHIALDMLGHDHPLVKRLLDALRSSDAALQEAYDGMYDEYEREYGEENREKLILEAAGKLVAKHLFREEYIRTNKVRNLITRISDAIKNFFRRFRRDEVQNAIFDANQIASSVARSMLGGRLIDDMSLANVASTGEFLQVQKDLTGKTDILSKLLTEKIKQLAIFKKRQGPRAKNKQSASVKAVEIQIKKLEAAIQNHKTEEAVATYLEDSLEFLKVTERSLLDAVSSGRPVNSICRKLNIVRDTLFNVSKAMTDVETAIRSGELQDSVGLNDVMSRIGLLLQKFYGEFDDLSMKYFEEMLSGVYGKEGKTVTIGKDRGKVITIHDMATKADSDVSFMSRMFNSLAHSGDYVLIAFDDIVRTAKVRGRRNTEAIRPAIEDAVAKLKKATGSLDQSFMFEMKRYDGSDWCDGKPDDGKLHRTGKYISQAEADHLPEAQREYYNAMMRIKREVEKFIPESLQDEDRMIMMRKYTMDRFKDAEGAKGKALEAWEGLKNRVLDTSEDLDYDHHKVEVDFQNNRVDMLPIKFIYKGKNETYDDMTDDVATSLLAYAGMAFEYHEMNGVIDTLENARYMASKREVTQKTGRRTQQETVEEERYRFDRDFTKKQAQTKLQQMLDDFFQMHVYGHIRANEGTFGRTRISKRKTVDTINSITSVSQMAVNIPQRISNILTGQTQQIIEATGKNGAFSGKSLRKAIGIYMKESADRLAQTGKTDYDNKLSLMAEYYDFHQDNGRYDPKYKKSRVSRSFNSGLLYAGLTMGEDYLALTTALAMALEYKMKDDKGNPATLWDAYTVKYTNPDTKTGAYLSLKPGYKKADGSDFTAEDEIAFGKRVAAFNFEMQGIYNVDDKSAIQQYAFGALIIMYRKWIAPSLKRRYAGVHYNRMKDSYDEGYHRTMARFIVDTLRDAKDQVTEDESAAALLNIAEDLKALKTSIMLNWSKMTDYERSNCKRSAWEIAIVIGLFALCGLAGKIPPVPDDEDDRGKFLQWWDQTLWSQLLRLRTEIGSQAPTPMMLDEAMHMLRSPLAAIEPLSNALNVFQLMYPPNYLTKVKGGRYSGRSKAYKYFRELPIIAMMKKVDNFIDPSPLINYYRNNAIY